MHEFTTHIMDCIHVATLTDKMAANKPVMTSMITCCFVSTVDAVIAIASRKNPPYRRPCSDAHSAEKNAMIKHMEQCILGMQFFPL